MTNKKLLLPVLFLLLITASLLVYKLAEGNNGDLVPQGGDEVKIYVNASKDEGKLPGIFSASVWIQKTYFTKTGNAYAGLSPYILHKFLNESRPIWIQTGNAYAIATSKNFSDFKEKLENTVLHNPYWIEIRDYANKNNVTVIFTFHQALTPNWLSSRAGEEWPIYQYAPPKCYKDKCTSWDEITCYTDECKRITGKQFRERGFVEGWESVAREYAKVLKKELGIRSLGIAVGHEPNGDWVGDEELFYKLYEYTVRGVKQVDETIKVGGVGSWGWSAPKVGCSSYCDANSRFANIPYSQVKRACELCVKEGGWANPNNKSMTENFIEYCRKNNVPLDFINYHAFHTKPEGFIDQSRTIREWLEGNDFSNVKIYPADWTIWGGGYPLADYIDDERNPAYVVRALYFMDEAGVDWHGHDFDVNDGGNFEKRGLNVRGSDAQFIGDWAIFTREGVIKPVWNAFKALSKLEGNRIEATSSDEDHVIAIASKDESKIVIIISNYIWPPAETALRAARKSFSNQSGDFIKGCLKNLPNEERHRKTLQKLYVQYLIAEERSPEEEGALKDLCDAVSSYCGRCPDYVRQDAVRSKSIAKKVYEQEKRYAENPRQVNLEIRGLNPGIYVLKIYVIDKDHANSCRYNKRTEPAPTDTACGIGGEIDRRVKQAKEDARNIAERQTKTFLEDKGYSDGDIQHLLSAVKYCEGDKACVENLVEKYYQRLDRCKNHPQNCSLDIIRGELKQAYDLYQNVFYNLFYYGKYKTVTIPYCIDKINNDPNVSLEGSKEEKIIRIGDDGIYREKIAMQPYSVVLLEFEEIGKRD